VNRNSYVDVVSRVDDSGSDVAGVPQVALPPPGTSTIRLIITVVSNRIQSYVYCLTTGFSSASASDINIILSHR